MDENSLLNRAMDQFEQRGGAMGPLFSATYHEIGVPRQWQRRTAQQSRFQFTFEQLRAPQAQDDLGHALMEAIYVAVSQIARERQISNQAFVFLSMVSNNTNYRNPYTSQKFHLQEWLNRSLRIHEWMNHLVSKLNSQESFDLTKALPFLLRLFIRFVPGQVKGNIVPVKKSGTNYARRNRVSSPSIIAMNCAMLEPW